LKKSSKEEGKTKPWTLLAKHKLRAEEELRNISGLNLIVIRPAIVYDVGDMSGISKINIHTVYAYFEYKLHASLLPQYAKNCKKK
jgi:hypothetical protein